MRARFLRPLRALQVVVLYNSNDAQNETGITEREISQVLSALDAAGYHSTSLPVAASSRVGRAIEGLNPSECIVLNLFESSGDEPVTEDALAAAALERAGFAYTGSTAQALALDKVTTKRLLTQQNLPTPRHCVFHDASSAHWDRYPAIVKPLNQHGSIGISSDSVVETPDRLAAQVHNVVESLHSPALVEDFIDGPEFSVSVWGNGCETTELPLIRIDYSTIQDRHGRLKTFDAKWRPGDRASRAIEITPAPGIDRLLEWRIARIAQAAYRAAGLRDYGRIDIRQQGEMLYILDVNPNPDIVSEGCSLVRSASCAGFDFDQVVSRLVEWAYRRAARRTSETRVASVEF